MAGNIWRLIPGAILVGHYFSLASIMDKMFDSDFFLLTLGLRKSIHEHSSSRRIWFNERISHQIQRCINFRKLVLSLENILELLLENNLI